MKKTISIFCLLAVSFTIQAKDAQVNIKAQELGASSAKRSSKNSKWTNYSKGGYT